MKPLIETPDETLERENKENLTREQEAMLYFEWLLQRMTIEEIKEQEWLDNLTQEYYE